MTAPAPGPGADDGLVLTAGQACDLDLALGGALPRAHLLGGALHDDADRSGDLRDPRDPRGVVVGLRVADVADRRPPFALRDAEHTPLAQVDTLDADPARPDVLLAHVSRRRARESRPLASLALDLDAAFPVPADRAVLVLLRAPVDDDTPAVDEFVRSAGALPGPPLVLVPEGGDLAHHLTARTAAAVARTLLGRSGLTGEVRVAPLHLRDDVTDLALVTGLLERLGAGHAQVVGGAGAGGRRWLEAVTTLETAAVDTPLRGIDEATAAVLRRWRPPRSRRGLVVMFTGLSGSGKSTVARDLADRLLVGSDRTVSLLDGDVVRRLLSSGLGFDRAGRETNVRRIGWVAAQVAAHGGVAICSPIAPFAQTRADIRAEVEKESGFVLVHVSTPLEVCEARDLKGLYARARAGEIPDFTGISSPYEEPEDADLSVDTSTTGRQESVQLVLDHLTAAGWIS